MKALFDGDIIVFRCGMAAERQVWYLAWGPMEETTPDGAYSTRTGEMRHMEQFEYKREALARLDEVVPGKWSREENVDYRLWSQPDLQPLSHALQNVKTLVARCLEATKCNDFDVEFYFSPDSGGTFRHRIATTREYKGNRKETRRPTYEKEIREFIQSQWSSVVAEDEEADDLLGIAQTKYGPHDSVIISLDKDLDQIPGLKYNYLHDVGYDISEKAAYTNFHIQLMTGDSTDNIPGLPGIGPAKATKALHGIEDEAEQLEEVARMYQIHSGKEDWVEYMNEQGALVYIRRKPDEMWVYNGEVTEEAFAQEVSRQYRV